MVYYELSIKSLTFLCIWNLDTLAIFPSEGPAVERTLYTVTADLTSDSKVSAKVRAVGIHDVGLAVILATEHNQLLTWVKEKRFHT